MKGRKQVAECKSSTTPLLYCHLPSHLFVVDFIISGPPGSPTNPEKAIMDRKLAIDGSKFRTHLKVFESPQGLLLLDSVHHHMQAQYSRMTQLESKLEPCMALVEIIHVLVLNLTVGHPTPRDLEDTHDDFAPGGSFAADYEIIKRGLGNSTKPSGLVP